MGSGKSAIARELARLTGWQWADTDRLVTERAGAPITQIFANRGEEAFREMESDALRSLAQREEAIVATGGGIVIRAENRDLLRSLGTVIWLTASEDVLFERVSRTRKRPLLECADPRAALRKLLAEREPFYAACADLKIDSSGKTHARVAEAVLIESHTLVARRPADSP
jgi:shikimate kinase